MENKIVDRVRKLLELSKSDNINEAAQAASLAQDLMLRYRIEQADLALAGEKVEAEEVVEVDLEGNAQKRTRAQRWRINLAGVLSRAFNSKIYFTAGTDRIGIVGCKSDVQTVSYLQQYFGLEIQRLVEAAWSALKADAPKGTELPRATVWKSSFREGAVHAIRQRMEHEKLKEKLRPHAATQAASAGGWEMIPEARGALREMGIPKFAKMVAELATEAPLASQQALVLVRESEEERAKKTSETWNQKFGRGRGKRRMRSSGWSRTQHSSDGYTAGRSAGSSIPLAGARGAIGAGATRLT